MLQRGEPVTVWGNCTATQLHGNGSTASSSSGGAQAAATASATAAAATAAPSLNITLNGATVASAAVDSEGFWNATLPPQHQATFGVALGIADGPSVQVRVGGWAVLEVRPGNGRKAASGCAVASTSNELLC